MTYEDVFTALGDPTRRAILETLREGPLSVGEIAEGLPVSRPAVSQHLAVLSAANLVVSEQDGTRRMYQANARGLEALRGYLEQYWGDLLRTFAAEATNGTRRKKR